MSQIQRDTADAATTQAILDALRTCYGDLGVPDFRRVHAKLDGDPHRRLIETLRSGGIEIDDTTDRNDDVSVQLVLDRDGDQVGLGLSGVGPFAALLHQDAERRYHWVTRSEDAPTPLAARVAEIVERAGLRLLDRDTAVRKIPMHRADGTTEATLYQALFTDTDQVP